MHEEEQNSSKLDRIMWISHLFIYSICTDSPHGNPHRTHSFIIDETGGATSSRFIGPRNKIIGRVVSKRTECEPAEMEWNED